MTVEDSDASSEAEVISVADVMVVSVTAVVVPETSSEVDAESEEVASAAVLVSSTTVEDSKAVEVVSADSVAASEVPTDKADVTEEGPESDELLVVAPLDTSGKVSDAVEEVSGIDDDSCEESVIEVVGKVVDAPVSVMVLGTDWLSEG